MSMASKREAWLFSLILSGLMSAVVAGISTWRMLGIPENFPTLWLGSWLNAWLVAFPCVLVMAPLTRRLVRGLLRHG